MPLQWLPTPAVRASPLQRFGRCVEQIGQLRNSVPLPLHLDPDRPMRQVEEVGLYLPEPRLIVVAVLLGIGVAAIVTLQTQPMAIDELVLDRDSGYELFSNYCENNADGEIYSRIENVESLGLRAGASSDTIYNADTLGMTVLPPSHASGLSLSGVERYQVFTGSGFYNYVDDRGMSTRNRQSPGMSMQAAIEWELSKTSSDSSVASILLRVTDLKDNKTLAIHPAFVWLGTSADSLPSPTFVPGRVRDSIIATCPQPEKLMRFVKDVARPGSGVTTLD